MRKLNINPNVNNSDSNYPNGRIRNNTGTGDGTPVNESVYGDIHVNKDKLMDLYGIVPNDLPDNELYGYQIIESQKALASKNDYILPLGLNAGILIVPIKLEFMNENESVICKSSFNLGSETQIKGFNATLFNFSTLGSFKTNEYVRLIKTSLGVVLVRLADAVSLDAMTTDLNYLKKATQTEENLGEIDTKATTPLVNKTVFAKRVNEDVTSIPYLASLLRNGLYPKEHYIIVAGLGDIVKTNVVILNGWTKDRKYSIAHGITTYNTILHVNLSLKCTVAEGGYAVGDIVNVYQRGQDQDGSSDYDYGVSAKWNENANANINIFVGDRVYIAYGPGDAAVVNNVYNVTDSRWQIRAVVIYK